MMVVVRLPLAVSKQNNDAAVVLVVKAIYQRASDLINYNFPETNAKAMIGVFVTTNKFL